jgi:signal transduction histidine kinase
MTSGTPSKCRAELKERHFRKTHIDDGGILAPSGRFATPHALAHPKNRVPCPAVLFLQHSPELMPHRVAPKLLVVEDDEEFRHLLMRALRVSGFEVVEATNGKDALAQLIAVEPDVVVLDLMMPGTDGWEFRVAQKKDPRVADIPVVVLTADDSAKAEAIDAALCLHKPIELRTLVSGVHAVLDRAERQRLATQLAHTERLASLGTLAAGIAHEINNPLTAVLGNATLARRRAKRLVGSDGARLLEPLDAVIECAERIQRIVREVSVFGRANDPVEQVLVSEVIDSALALLDSELRAVAQVSRHIEAETYVVANRGRLMQVVVNLLMNAAQAISDAQSGKISVSTGVWSPGEVFITVSDTGPGIPEPLRQRIFDPFFTTKPPGQGTGLGLSICASLVRALSGRIEVESAVGEGTQMRVILPIAGNATAGTTQN